MSSSIYEKATLLEPLEMTEALNHKFCGTLHFKFAILWFSKTRNGPKSSILIPSYMKVISYQ